MKNDSIVSADSMTESIRNFSAPKNIIGAKAFFGLVEQVSFSFSKCADMISFNHVLSPKVKIVWTEALVKEFKVLRVTALVTDWAQEGQSLGFRQKHCDCKGPVTIVCCHGGWRIVFMFSRFNNDAQSCYSPIEDKRCKTSGENTH